MNNTARLIQDHQCLADTITVGKVTYKNTVWHKSFVDRVNREKLNSYRGAIIWFTGLSGSGKSSYVPDVLCPTKCNYQ